MGAVLGAGRGRGKGARRAPAGRPAPAAADGCLRREYLRNDERAGGAPRPRAERKPLAGGGGAVL
ncbi:MAG: hypothetical protein Kow0058_05870 [Roseovarius sp.]